MSYIRFVWHFYNITVKTAIQGFEFLSPPFLLFSWYAMIQGKRDGGMASTVSNNRQGGRKHAQKYKSLLVWQILLKRTDENNGITVGQIEEHLKEYGITAERRSIYRDIRDLQELLEADYDAKIEDRERLGYEISYTRKAPSGFKITHRPYDFEDLRLLAECINSARV